MSVVPKKSTQGREPETRLGWGENSSVGILTTTDRRCHDIPANGMASTVPPRPMVGSHPVRGLPPRSQLYTHESTSPRPMNMGHPERPLFVHGRIESLGPPHLQIYRAALPFDATDTLRRLIDACEAHVQTMTPCGTWDTHLYSLTRQDVAVADVVGGLALVATTQAVVKATIRRVYQPPSLHLDRNQPHVLKYDASHRSVPLHHDCCHVTVNLMMSPFNSYVGGGTYFKDLDRTVYLERGEFLLHPGHALHAGGAIASGTRYLLVSFVHFGP